MDTSNIIEWGGIALIAVLIFADMSGKEFIVAKSDIVERTPSKYTLMPDQFGTSISPEDFNALIAYLLTIKN